jgi:hypothetical protein
MSITAVLTLYKRPYTLIQQLQAIQSQSVLPENIIIWKNYSEGVCMPEIPLELKKNVIFIDSSKNFGVWGRFTVGLLVNSKYICVFDDDTIPGCDWFKNCIETMSKHRGLLGTIGLRFHRGNNYDVELPKKGWDGPNDITEQVDIVGHAWFFEKEWLSYLWQYQPDYNYMLAAGEDICFSYCLQKNGINTYVPPHPKNNRNLWGSIPEIARHYGNDCNATYLQPDGCSKFDLALKQFISLGFITMNNR